MIDRLAVDASNRRRRRLKGQNLASGDQRLRSRSQVASDALALRAYTEFAERIQLHRLAFLNRRSDLLEKIF